MSPGAIAIRAARTTDRAGWLPLWNGYNAFYGRSGETALPPDVTTLTWGRILDPATPMWGILACREERPIGLAHFLFHLSTTSAAPACYLQDLFVAEPERRGGVAARLIEAVCERASTAGAPSVYWQTHQTNERAMRLYDQVAARSEFLIYRRMLA